MFRKGPLEKCLQYVGIKNFLAKPDKTSVYTPVSWYNKMMKLRLKKIFKELDLKICERDEEAQREGFLFNPNFEIKILGQMSLIANVDVASKFDLIGTMDVDAYTKGTRWIEKEFDNLLKNEGLRLDSDSSLIWMPEESTYTEFIEGKYLKVFLVDPIYCLASKAIKAKEKNKVLIMEALVEYGEELEDLIKKYKGDLEYFYE